MDFIFTFEFLGPFIAAFLFVTILRHFINKLKEVNPIVDKADFEALVEGTIHIDGVVGPEFFGHEVDGMWTPYTLEDFANKLHKLQEASKGANEYIEMVEWALKNAADEHISMLFQCACLGPIPDCKCVKRTRLVKAFMELTS